jgi:hypothetical protein
MGGNSLPLSLKQGTVPKDLMMRTGNRSSIISAHSWRQSMSDNVRNSRWGIAPYFIVDDVVTTANFYRDKLGFATSGFGEIRRLSAW